MGFHHGGLQVVPPTWTFPRMAFNQLIDNWYVGNKREEIPPLEILSALYVAHFGTPGNCNAGKVKLRQMKCVMATMDKYAKKENCYLSDKDLCTSEYTKGMWEKIREKYLIYEFGGQNRNAYMSWKTLYNKMPKEKVLIQGYIEATPHLLTQ